jgi:hypothetical protein
MSNKLLLKSYVGGADNMFFQLYVFCLYFECQLNFSRSSCLQFGVINYFNFFSMEET